MLQGAGEAFGFAVGPGAAGFLGVGVRQVAGTGRSGRMPVWRCARDRVDRGRGGLGAVHPVFNRHAANNPISHYS
ncbi:hypothetical protein [Saccharothrix espanaensis]|uniref:hypothetical protein n=1 Tax=Saccharothrix espanaensis TaxID=103731 RepID=UPI0002FA64F6|nr:hypothetical protein [Saccharothrix espanaensis]